MSVIVVGHGPEPMLPACLRAVIRQLGDRDELVLVDHGIRALPEVDQLRVVTPSFNSGFGGGCATGAEATVGDVLVFINSDAIVQVGAIAALAEAVQRDEVGLAGGLVLLANDPDRVDSAGLPVHLTGLSWCHGFGEPATNHQEGRSIASVAGALFACRREVWELLGGMDESYFMYHEDTDLSLRCHLAGLDVVLVPTALATHDHDFSRNARKMFLLERNRFLTVLADFPTHLLLRTLPVLVLLEPMYLLVAARDGWAVEKVRTWMWLLRHPRIIRDRRRRVQAQVRSPLALDDLLTPTVSQTQLEVPPAMALLNRVLALYWTLARPRARIAP
ncbi:glycosyltransferase [Knoellia aerolata]|nr:glycosyltransferase family 2 protein [Knoellia aerolata]